MPSRLILSTSWFPSRTSLWTNVDRPCPLAREVNGEGRPGARRPPGHSNTRTARSERVSFLRQGSPSPGLRVEPRAIAVEPSARRGPRTQKGLRMRPTWSSKSDTPRPRQGDQLSAGDVLAEDRGVDEVEQPPQGRLRPPPAPSRGPRLGAQGRRRHPPPTCLRLAAARRSGAGSAHFGHSARLWTSTNSGNPVTAAVVCGAGLHSRSRHDRPV